MSSMTLEDLCDKLRSKSFSDTANGDLFYNFYMFQYPAAEEYKWRREIMEIKDKLVKPANYLDILTLNLFDEFCSYLHETPFGKKIPHLLEYLLDKEAKGGPAIEQVQKSLSNHAQSDKFLEFLNEKIEAHVADKNDELHRPYVFIYGIGQMFPYLRANTFLTKYEKLNQDKVNKIKLILFYPGNTTNDGTRFKLFGLLNDDHTYRAHLLINEED